MRSDKEEAIKLRRENKSYNEISTLLGIPKSTLSGWFKNIPESQKTKLLLSQSTNPKVAARIKKFAHTNSVKWEKFREEAREEARREFPKLLKNPLFTIGLTMYWAEGDNRIKNPVKFANTDPRMVSIFVKFATEAINIPASKIRVGLLIYPDIDPIACKKYWSEVTRVPYSQFHKTCVIQGKNTKRRLPNGICMITLGSRRLKEKILVWIDLFSKAM